MSDHQMQNHSLWELNYYQQPVGELDMLYQGFCDVSTEFYSKNPVIQPDERTYKNADHVAGNTYAVSSPEAANPAISPGKPKRRRSKGTPSQSTTFLNASIKNFRALVQQHTGCHNTATSSPKGPITLCFGSPSSTHHHDANYLFNHQSHYA